MKILSIGSPEEAKDILKKIGVDSYGVGSMAPKTLHLNILLESQPCKVANIIKQEMLSLGGDAAIARGSVACSVEASDILIMGTEKQIGQLSKKLRNQPFGLKKIAEDLSQAINNLHVKKYVFRTSRRKMILGERTLIMGILNVTPDSFSDGGMFSDTDRAVKQALKMEEEGADIIDIGGESTRPGSKPVPARVELQRVLPVIEALSRKIKIPISIDTQKAQVARRAVEAGAEIINDISALNTDKKMGRTAGETGAGLVLMHMRGRPDNMQKGDLTYGNLLGEIAEYLQKSVQTALKAGVEKDKIILDPGIGFGKTFEDNYKLIKNLSQLKTLGLPLLVGPSRKSFIGKITGGEPRERLEGTAAAVAAAIMNGCHIVRVHDVAVMKKVAAVTDAIVRA
ncbi:MAG TPA: dihydropteroate synthase [Smithella sp.]|nr:dihydropteroate synthase [Smithella sp.]